MPMYDYRCSDCDTQFEELILSINHEEEDFPCPSCGSSQTERLLSAPAVSVKGGTGFRSGNANVSTGNTCSAPSGFS